jgi:hypothetical protein
MQPGHHLPLVWEFCHHLGLINFFFGGILHRVVIRVCGFLRSCGALVPFSFEVGHSAIIYNRFQFFEIVWIKFGAILDWNTIRVCGLLGFWDLAIFWLWCARESRVTE